MRYENSILAIINTAKDHLTAEQIYLTLKQSYPSVVLATVYNNLNNLCQKRLIRKISVEGYPDRYDKIIRHDHLLCSRCGRLTDIYLSDITTQLERQLGHQIDGYDLKIHFLCSQCRDVEASDQKKS